MRLSRFDHIAMLALLLLALAMAGKGWLDAHPGDNPWAPLDLRDRAGWATPRKLASLRSDPALCRQVLKRSEVAFKTLPSTGAGVCARPDRVVLSEAAFAPASPATTCAVAAATSLWLVEVQEIARTTLGSDVQRIEHFGTYSCRRVNGQRAGAWSEHATGNAIDIAAFVLADGQRVRIAGDWAGPGRRATFLHQVRDAACGSFGTVLSPDYNAAHYDHLHLDQAARGWGGVCR
jgi:hypothetical protein